MSDTINPNKDPRQEQGQKSTEQQTTAMPTTATMPITPATQDTAARTQPTTVQGTSNQRTFPSPYAAPAPAGGTSNAAPLSGAPTAQRDPGLANLVGSGQQGGANGQTHQQPYRDNPFAGSAGAPGYAAAADGNGAGNGTFVPGNGVPGTPGAGAVASKISGKAVAIVAGVTLVCGLLGGVAGGFTVNALSGGSDSGQSSQMGGMNGGMGHGQMGQMPGGGNSSGGSSDSDSDSDSSGNDGSGNSQGGQMGQPPSGGQGGQTQGGSSGGSSTDGDTDSSGSSSSNSSNTGLAGSSSGDGIAA